MSSKRIGEILSNLVPLTGHDVEEILSEQSASRKRFGDIALAMGLCRPEHVWKACSAQLDTGPREIDLDTFGVDVQALAQLAPTTARAIGVIPVRVFGDELVVAAHEHSITVAAEALPAILPMRIKFVIAPKGQVERAIGKYYPKRGLVGA